MQKIVPHLWFDKEAKEAAAFYVEVFGQNSQITHQSVIHNTPSGDTDILSFELWGYEFQAISAGPYFKLNPSISFMVNFDPSQDTEAKTKIDELWNKLAEGGKVMMAIDKYPWSERYGFVQDKYGVSWQLILTNPEGEPRPQIMPSLIFVNEKCGKAEEAVDFYLSVFSSQGGSVSGGKSSKLGTRIKYGPGQEPNKEGTVMFSDFQLFDGWFTAMDGAGKHEFDFNEALSFIVRCDTQEEIDEYWQKLSAVPESEQCGWLKDKFGVSWQIVPTVMNEMMSRGTPEQMARVTEAFLKMKKFNIAELEKAYNG